MDTYHLFIYRDDGQLVGSAVVTDAANDDDAIAQAEVVRGPFIAELLDIEGLRIVKYLPRTWRSASHGKPLLMLFVLLGVTSVSTMVAVITGW